MKGFLICCLAFAIASSVVGYSISDNDKVVFANETATPDNVTVDDVHHYAGERLELLVEVCGDETNLTMLSKCLWTFSTFSGENQIRNLFKYTGCALQNITFAHGYLCSVYGISADVDEYVRARSFDVNVCTSSRMATWDLAAMCYFRCKPYTYATCSKYAGAGIVGRNVWSFLRLFDRKRAGESIIDARVGASLLVASRGAIMRHAPLIIATAFMTILFFKEVALWLRVILAFVAVGIFAYQRLWLQALLSGGIAIAVLTGQSRNLNNAQIAGLGAVLMLLIPVIDTADDIRLSLLFTFLIIALIFGLIAALLSKRLSIDTVTIAYLVLVGANVFVAFRIILRHKGGSDPFFATLQYLLAALLPYGTAFAFFFVETIDAAADYAAVIARVLDSTQSEPVLAVIFFVLRYVLWAAMRTIVGVQVTHRMRGMDLSEQAWRGFLLVWLDKLAPFEVLRSVSTRSGRASLGFATVSTALQVFELLYSTELYLLGVVLAIIFWIVDYRPARTGKVLAFMPSRFEDGAFKCIDSMPWADLDLLAKLRCQCVRVRAATGTAARYGSGILLKMAGNTKLFTVNHIVGDASSVDVSISDDKWHSVSPDDVRVWGSGSSDPAVSMEVAGLDVNFGVPLLSNTELNQISTLILLHREGMINWVKNFSFTRGIIEMGVDLMTGDSGTPVFAVLRSGKLRLAGVVSRGSMNEGKANTASSVVCDVSQGSDGKSNDSTSEYSINANAVAEEHINTIEEMSKRAIDPKAKPRTKADAKRKAITALTTLSFMSNVTVDGDVRAAIEGGKAVTFNRRRTGTGPIFTMSYTQINDEALKEPVAAAADA